MYTRDILAVCKPRWETMYTIRSARAHFSILSLLCLMNNLFYFFIIIGTLLLLLFDFLTSINLFNLMGYIKFKTQTLNMTSKNNMICF